MKVVVEFALVDKLRVFSVDRLNLNSNFEVSLGVNSLIDLSESTLINLSDDFEILAHLLQHLRHRNYYDSNQ